VDRRRIASGSPYEASIGFSRAVRVGRFVAVSGTAPVWPDGSVDPDPLVQARRAWAIALGALADAGGRPEHVIRTRQFLVDRADEEVAAQVHGEVFADVRPASSMVIVAGLLDPRWRFEFELDAIVTDDDDDDDDDGDDDGHADDDETDDAVGGAETDADPAAAGGTAGRGPGRRA
jgi:enamine deaminase RidA (YjgF/YER057c/UK114 family)